METCDENQLLDDLTRDSEWCTVFLGPKSAVTHTATAKKLLSPLIAKMCKQPRVKITLSEIGVAPNNLFTFHSTQGKESDLDFILVQMDTRIILCIS
jgi:hypothetical protein